MGFGGLISKVADGLFSSIVKDGVPLARAVGANAVNNLPGFYGGGLARAKAVVKGGLTTASDMALEQLNPITRKTRDQFGISRRTQKVAQKTIKTLESPKVKEIEGRRKELLKLNKNITRANNQGDEVKVSELTKQRDAIVVPTLAEKEIAREAGKEAQGQISYQFLQNEMQGTPSNILTEKFFEENYFDVLPLSKENFSDMQYIKEWETSLVPNMDNVMSTAFNRIQNAWGKDLKVDDAIMFIKKPFASKASANLPNEINTNAKVDARVRKALIKKGSGFNTAKEMQDYLTKELKSPPNFEIKDGALWFAESFKSSAKELGGVNLQTAVLPDGTAIQFISDVQDLFKMRMPAGQDGLSVTAPMFKNYLRKKQPTVQDKTYKKVQDVLSKERSGLFTDVSEAMGGMNANQTALVRELAELKPDKLTVEEWVTYLSKMGIGASVVTPMAGGLLTSQER